MGAGVRETVKAGAPPKGSGTMARHIARVAARLFAAQGYDAETMGYVDMVQAGIIDPTKVARVALQNAASIASLLLTVEAVISDLPEAGRPGGPPMPPGDMY